MKILILKSLNPNFRKKSIKSWFFFDIPSLAPPLLIKDKKAKMGEGILPGPALISLVFALVSLDFTVWFLDFTCFRSGFT